MRSCPSASVRYAPRPWAANRGLPPTEPKARTGELTPPGITRFARSKSSSLVVNRGTSGQPVCGFLGVVGEDEVGAGAADRGENLESGGPLVEPAFLGRGLHHRVLAGDVV